MTTVWSSFGVAMMAETDRKVILSKEDAIELIAPFSHQFVRPRYHVQRHWFDFSTGGSDTFFFRKRFSVVSKVGNGSTLRTYDGILASLNLALDNPLTLFFCDGRRYPYATRLRLDGKVRPYVEVKTRFEEPVQVAHEGAAPLLLDLYKAGYRERDRSSEEVLLDICIDGTGLPLKLLSPARRDFLWAERFGVERQLVTDLAMKMGVRLRSKGNWWKLTPKGGKTESIQGLYKVYKRLLELR